VERPVFALPTGLRAGALGQEQTIELPVTLGASDDSLHLDDPQSLVSLAPPGERGLDLVEREQAVGVVTSPQSAQRLPRVRPPSGAVEIVIYLVFSPLWPSSTTTCYGSRSSRESRWPRPAGRHLAAVPGTGLRTGSPRGW